MSYVDQTITGQPNGNCTAACVASLIGEPVEAVPNFNQWGEVFGHWEVAAAAWLMKRNWTISSAWNYDWALEFGVKAGVIRKGEVIMAGGLNPDGVGHMVLFRDGEMVHDPNPDRRGLAGPPEFLITVRPTCENCKRDHATEDCPRQLPSYALASK